MWVKSGCCSSCFFGSIFSSARPLWINSAIGIVPPVFSASSSGIRSSDWQTGQITSFGCAGLDTGPFEVSLLVLLDSFFGAIVGAAGVTNSARATEHSISPGALNGTRISAQHRGQWMTSPLQARLHSRRWPQEGHSNFTSHTIHLPLSTVRLAQLR